MTEQKEEFLVVFNEVCRDDYYQLKSVSKTPDVIFDIGANTGAFTTYARFLFPKAQIVSVEPDDRNFDLLEQHTSHLPNVQLLKKAIGTGEIWAGIPKLESPYYGTVRSYVTLDQLGFSSAQIDKPPGRKGCDDYPAYEKTLVDAISLAELVSKYTAPEDGVLLKLDCEGGENCIFADPPSMEALRRVDVITMETHLYTKGTGKEHQANAEVIYSALASLGTTHHWTLDQKKRYFHAIKKEPPCKR